MAAPAELTRIHIEAMFRPSTRFRDYLDTVDESVGLPEHFTEIELLPHLTPESLLAMGTWEDFYDFVDDFGEDHIVWMSPGIYVCSGELSCIDDPVGLYVSDGDDDLCVHVTEGTTDAETTATCDSLVLLLATTQDKEVFMQGSSDVMTNPLPVSAETLSRIFQESRNLPRTFAVSGVTLNEEQIRALETAPGPDLEVMLASCSLPDDIGSREAFVACLQSDGCPIKLQGFIIDCQVLAIALQGNCRVTSLVLPYGWLRDDTRKGVILRSLAENKGLVHVGLHGHSISDENLSVLSQSLKAHPTITSLDLRDTNPWAQDGGRIVLSDEQKAKRTSLVAEMMHGNTILQTINFSIHERDNNIYSQVIVPHLETNCFRPRVLTVKEIAYKPFREKVLGRAVYCVRSNPNLVWMLLSQNVDGFVQPEEEESNSKETVAVVRIGTKRKHESI